MSALQIFVPEQMLAPRRSHSWPSESAAPKTYSLHLWDHDIDDWALEVEGLTKWGLRAAIRAALEHGYDWDYSILVKAD